MQATNPRRPGSAALTGVFLLLLSGLSPAVFSQDDRDPQGTETRHAGAAERLELEPWPTVEALVSAFVDRVLALAPSRFLGSPGNKVFVERVLPDRRDEPPVVGIIVDDGVPF